MDVVSVAESNGPLLVSFPHSGTAVPEEIKETFTQAALPLPDTDWYVPRLYDFLAEMAASTITANHSRYLVDVNRFSQGSALYPGQSETEVCPTTTFTEQDIYLPGKAPTKAQIQERIKTYWQPYHDALARQLERIKAIHGYALLWDAHSIASEVPRFFTGTLPDLNLGTADGLSCQASIGNQLFLLMQQSQFSAVRDSRFKGGYITRHYGQPQEHIHAVQMEIAQNAYMEEHGNNVYDEIKAAKLSNVLRTMTSELSRYKL
jgi:N-formylglutamate deformylase